MGDRNGGHVQLSMSTMVGVALKREKKKMELEGGFSDAETIEASKYWDSRHIFFPRLGLHFQELVPYDLQSRRNVEHFLSLLSDSPPLSSVSGAVTLREIH